MEETFSAEDFLRQQFETLQTANEYIVKLETGIVESVRLLKSGEEGQAIKMIHNIIDGIEWISDVMRLTIGVHNQQINLDEVNGQLLEIVEGFNNEDYILVGDLFEYEILPIIVKWKAIIKNSITN